MSIRIEGRNVPTPTYDYEVSRLVQSYKRALVKIQGELLRADVTNLQAAQTYALQESIRRKLGELDSAAIAWVSENIPNAAKDGVASSLVSLGLVSDLEQAKKIADFNKTNEHLVKTAVAYVGDDILAITKNMNIHIQNKVRTIAATAIRENITAGYGMRTIRNDMRQRITQLQQELAQAANVAIVDSAGRKWGVDTYTEMLSRTVLHNVHTEAVTNEALGRGANYATISINPTTRDACRYHEGRVIKLDPNADGDFMTYDELKATGQIFHPNCKHHLLPFSRFDRLNDYALKTAEKQEAIGRAATEAGGRNPDESKVSALKAAHTDAFKVPQVAKPTVQSKPIEQQAPQQPKPKAPPKPKDPEVIRGHLSLRYEHGDRAAITELVAKDMRIGIPKAQRVVESVRQWSGYHYGDIRAIQRKEKDPKYYPEAAQYAKDIDEFIKKSPKWGDTSATYRGIGVDRAVAEKILLQLSKKNGKIDMQGAASWSSARRVADNFSGRGEVKMIFINKGKTMKGTSIQHISKYDTEDEILVAKTAKYKALDIIKHNDNYYEIEVEEV